MPTRKPISANPVVRGRIWVECEGQPALTEAGADLLEQISICGSLSEAARRLRFSYRRAWLLLDSMNHRWPRPLVKTAIGGVRGGGATVTELGLLALRTFRDVQVQLEHALDEASESFHRLK